MKLMYNNTLLKINIKETEDNFGLKENDRWCLVHILIKNDETNYEINKDILTKKEITDTINTINKFINNEISSINIKYIKNFIKIHLLKKTNKKILELVLIEPKTQSNKTHKVYLEEQELLGFIKLLKGE